VFQSKGQHEGPASPEDCTIEREPYVASRGGGVKAAGTMSTDMTTITIRAATVDDAASIVALDTDIEALHTAALPDLFKSRDAAGSRRPSTR
jgi:hypothetical protein